MALLIAALAIAKPPQAKEPIIHDTDNCFKTTPMKNIRPLTKLPSFLFISLFCCACFSHYPKVEKLPCYELGNDPKDNIRKIIISTGFKERDIIMSDKSVQYRKNRTINYSEIVKTIFVRKGKRNTVVIVMNDGKRHGFLTFDYNLAINVQSTFGCLAGIKSKNPNSSTDKYDRLAKLKTLLDSGALSNEEYEKEKKKILIEN